MAKARAGSSLRIRCICVIDIQIHVHVRLNVDWYKAYYMLASRACGPTGRRPSCMRTGRCACSSAQVRITLQL